MTDKVLLTGFAPWLCDPGKLPSLSEPLFPPLQSEDSNRALCGMNGCTALSAGHPDFQGLLREAVSWPF